MLKSVDGTDGLVHGMAAPEYDIQAGLTWCVLWVARNPSRHEDAASRVGTRCIGGFYVDKPVTCFRCICAM